MMTNLDENFGAVEAELGKEMVTNAIVRLDKVFNRIITRADHKFNSA